MVIRLFELGHIPRPVVVVWAGPISAWHQYDVHADPTRTGYVAGVQCGSSRRLGLTAPANFGVLAALTPSYELGLAVDVLTVLFAIALLIASNRRETRRHRQIVRDHRGRVATSA